MDLKLIFRSLAAQLREDFDISSQMGHPGTKGEYREDALKNFLVSRKLPDKFGIANGEIISSKTGESKHFDLIIYDRAQCPFWVFGDRNQVIPIEGVYGVIEVSSKLSKTKLLEGVKKITDLKNMVPQDTAVRKGPYMEVYYPRPFPFGIIFGYKLAGNSLNSLELNLKEANEGLDPRLWANLIVVLEEGIIYYKDENGKRVFNSLNFRETFRTIGIHFKKDTLIEFYYALLNMANDLHLGNIDFSRYKDLPTRLGSFSVSGHDRFVRFGEQKVYALNEKFIKRVVKHCSVIGKKPYKEILLSELGEIPIGVKEETLSGECYHYDPDNLPGFRDVPEPFREDENGNIISTERMKVPSIFITVDGETYIIPYAYIEQDCLTVVEGKSIKDL